MRGNVYPNGYAGSLTILYGALMCTKHVYNSLTLTFFVFMVGPWFFQDLHASTLNQKSPLAINVAGMVRWNTDWPLIDEMKRAEVVTQCTGENCWNTLEHHKVDWDSNGWPRSLNGGRFNKISYVLFGGDYGSWGVHTMPPGGRFHVIYDGEGILEYKQAASYAGSCGPGCDLVDIQAQGNGLLALISITETNSNNHLRNIRVIWPGGICNGDVFTYQASEAACPGQYQSFVELKDQITFHPDYLDDLKQYKAIRFMNYQVANETTADPVNVNQQTRWADRRMPSYSVWSDSIPVNAGSDFPKKGVPVETMIELINVLGADGWFTLPFTATDNYVQQFARLAKQNLNKDQKVYLEFGNEAWNFAWPFSLGANWLQAKGKQFWPGGGTDYDKQMNWFAKRTTEICKLWKAEWGGDSGRVECVLGGHAAGSWVTENLILKCPLWKDDNRNAENAGQTCASQVDAVAIAPYFGGYIGDPNYQSTVQGWDLNALFSEILQGNQLSGAAETLGIPASPARYLGGSLEDRPSQNEIPVAAVSSAMAELPAEGQIIAEAAAGGALNQARGWMSEQAAIAQKYGVDLLAYEGGQHLVGVNGVENNGTITQLFGNTNRNAKMSGVYTQYLNDWRETGGKLFAVFEAVGPYSKWGSWGLKEYQNQANSPKYAAVQQFITDNPCWWDGCEGGGEVVSYPLTNNKWHLIGLPRALANGENTVADVFGDDLIGLTYNTDWAMFFYDSANGSYVNPGLTDLPLKQGVGYWIIQKSGVDVTLTLPSASLVTPMTTSPQCTSAKGCFEIPLDTQEGKTGWNLLAHVFESETTADQWRVVTKTGSVSCASVTGCTLGEAKIANIVHDQFWHFNGVSYETLEGSDLIKPWYGLWAAALNQAAGLEPKLLIPAP